MINKRKKHPRHYCPVCGEVREAYLHWSEGLIIEEHARYVRSGGYRTEKCPGGPVDDEKDKAP